MPRVVDGTRLAGVPEICGASGSGRSRCPSTCAMRRPVIGPCPKRARSTATTPWGTLAFRYTVMFCTFTTVVLVTTTLFTTRGPPHPRQEGP
jgi:hypothetical protein